MVAEIGYWIGKDYRNHGYMTQVLKKVIDIYFKEYSTVRVHATHGPLNLASGKVMLNARMEYEGNLKAHVKKDGIYQDSLSYSIINPVK